MASPQKENGFTSIANEILEHLSQPGINGSEYRVLIFLLRKTYGFHKKTDKISLSQFQKGTGMKRANVVETIKSLVVKRLLLKEKNLYSFNKNWEQWVVVKRLPPVVKSILPSSQTTTKTSSQLTTYKRKKETNTKDIAETSSAEVVNLIKSFEGINPASKGMYGNTTQREACERLIKEFTFQRVLSVITKTLPKTNALEFFPNITTPRQLWDKWASLESAIVKFKGSKIKSNNVAFQ